MGTRRGQGEELRVTWEIEVVGGEEGKAFARRQADVMAEVLARIAEQRRKHGDTTTSGKS